MMRNTLPLGQDLLVYTPPTGKSLLPVTVAVDLRGSIDEQEVNRKGNALHFDGEEYMQVTKKGKRDVNLYFDKKTNLLVKAEYRALDPFTLQEVAQEKLFSGYKELVPGLKMASKELINSDGKRFMDMEITELRQVERHDDSVFARPK